MRKKQSEDHYFRSQKRRKSGLLREKISACGLQNSLVQRMAELDNWSRSREDTEQRKKLRGLLDSPYWTRRQWKT